jgi:hypothetical protein
MRTLVGMTVATVLAAFMATAAYAQDTGASLDTNQCFSFGARLGSDIYVRCRLKLAEMRQLQQQTNGMEAAQAQAADQARRGAIFGALNNPNCTTTYIGMQADIHCK